MKEFFHIAENAWLFKSCATNRSTLDRHWTPAEEWVRQWCLHELIRQYGISIQNIIIECEVRVARERRAHRIDILVKHEGKPYIVIECKSEKVPRLDHAMRQAINYASLETIRAPYAACTNGLAWWVRRRIGTEWIIADDIPDFRSGNPGTSTYSVLLAINCLSPILHWLDTTVSSKQAAYYFHSLQRFYNSRNGILVFADENLILAADNLLRVLADISNHRNYMAGKITEMCNGLNQFWMSCGVKAGFGGGDLREMVHYAYAELSMRLDDRLLPATINEKLLRLILSLLAYLKAILSAPGHRYCDVTTSIQNEVRSFLDTALTLRFNAPLPDPLDPYSIDDLREVCKPGWENLLNQLRC